MAITRTAIVDDDGTGTTGTVINNSWKQEFYDQIDAADLATARYKLIFNSDTGGTKNDWAPAGVGNANYLIEWYSGTAVTMNITGIKVGQTQGASLVIRNTGIGLMLFNHNHTGSTAGNRFLLAVGSSATPVFTNGWISFVFDGTFWICTGHEQGAWISPGYSAANFGTSGGSTWTVDAGDVESLGYYLRGSQITLSFAISLTSVSVAVANLRFNNGCYGGFTTALRRCLNPFMNQDNGAALNNNGWAEAPAGGTYVTLTRQAGLWSVAANATGVFGQITFEVS